MLVPIPNGVYRWREAGVCEVADGYIDHVWRELTVPVDGAAARRAEIGIEPFAGVGYATPRGALATGLLNGGLRPVARVRECAPRGTLAFKDLKNRTPLDNAGSWKMLSIAEQTFDAMQGAIARQKLAAYPPDHTIMIARDACGTLEFDRADEMIALGYETAAQTLGKL